MTTLNRALTAVSVPEPPSGNTPPLQNGDRLTRPEFERRYRAMSGVKKAELIEGIVYMPSPVSQVGHGGPHFDVIGWLAVYRAATPGVIGGDNSTLRLDLDNEPQPDAFLMIRPESAGQARLDEDGYVAGGPELIVEIAASSVSYDLHQKLNVYRRNGVREYVVLRVRDRTVDWFVLRDGSYEPLGLGDDGLFRSEVFPGLQLSLAALIEGDLAQVLHALQNGLATPEHAAFVQRLREASGAS